MIEKPSFIKPDTFREVSVLPNGCTLYVANNVAGGRTYFSDEIGGGVMVWDTCLVDTASILQAIVEEDRIRYRENVKKSRLARMN
jgi:hypothetical protein